MDGSLPQSKRNGNTQDGGGEACSWASAGRLRGSVCEPFPSCWRPCTGGRAPVTAAPHRRSSTKKPSPDRRHLADPKATLAPIGYKDAFNEVAMTTTGKCPKCQKPIDRLLISRVEAGEDLRGSTYRALTLQCPACATVLGAQLERMFDDAGNKPRGISESPGNTSH
jgi:hypothetical protein